MKLLILLCAFTLNCIASNNVYLKDTTIKAQTFQMFRGAKGGKFIVITSKTGNQYKKYFK